MVRCVSLDRGGAPLGWFGLSAVLDRVSSAVQHEYGVNIVSKNLAMTKSRVVGVLSTASSLRSPNQAEEVARVLAAWGWRRSSSDGREG